MTEDIAFGRAECGDLARASDLEWLVTNGLGGYASGTVAGVCTRRYHGLLCAALRPPVARTLLVAKLDGAVAYDGERYGLATNVFADGTVDPHGYRHLEGFALDGLIPVWRYAVADARLDQQVWMAHGANTTYVMFTLRRASRPLRLTLTALCTYRDHHALRPPRWEAEPRPVAGGFELAAFTGAQPYRVVADRGTFVPIGTWYHAFHHAAERARGFDADESLFAAGRFEADLAPSERLTIVCSTEPVAPHAGDAALAAERQRQATLSARARADDPPWVRRLFLAADAFVVRREAAPPATSGDPPAAPDGLPAAAADARAGAHAPPAGHGAAAGDVAPTAPDPPTARGFTVIAGYPWFTDWGRDTMIALPGLALATGRPDVAAGVLRTFARFASRGMLPNRFPDAGEAPDYNTVDATLWFFHALDAYLQATDDDALARDLYETLVDIVDWHRRGTRFAIGVDPEDGLVRAGRPGTQLTWMDAKAGDHAFTPRVGKPVEVNALWHHALRVTAAIAARVGDTPAAAAHAAAADRTAASFRSRFWNAAGGYLFDVVDGPAGVRQPDGRLADPALRPNQIIAVALPSPLLAPEAARAVVDACARHLFTSHGLRSLAPGEPAYAGRYAGDPWSRDAAYHQGTAWAWLLGPFVRAHHRVYGDAGLARSFLDGIAPHLAAAGLGSIGEVFDGDAPFRPGGCPWQAWSVAEVLHAYRAVASPPL